jgi:ActR/RegA family two-component response regulator
MPMESGSGETVLIVDDEESVRKTFREWLEGANLGCKILTAADAESALVHANQHVIDLAILDWNLGSGNDGLKLLEDLAVFNPDVVAIMITGFAHQATPLDAMRMGVRDYLDKNQDLNRTTFLRAVRRQLERVRPAKRERQLHQGLVAFRAAVEKVLPLVQAAVALNDPVPLPAAVASLFRFLMRTTGARDGVLLVRAFDSGRPASERLVVYDANGTRLDVNPVPFARSVAGSAATMQEPSVMTGLGQIASSGSLELQPFEQGRHSLLAAPLDVNPGLSVVLELFDKQTPDGRPDPNGFTEADRRLVGAAAEFGAALLRQTLAERQAQQVLFDAVEAALGASDSVAESLRPSGPKPEDPPAAAILDRVRDRIASQPGAPLEGDDTVRLAETIRVLALRYGSSAVRHCLAMVEGLRRLLDEATGTGEARP